MILSINKGKVVPRSVIWMLAIKRLENNVGWKLVKAIIKPMENTERKKNKIVNALAKKV